MVLSDATNRNGLIQRCEYYCGLGDGGISGDTTLLKIFIENLNEAFDTLMPLLLSYTNKGRWDDTNNTDFPIGKFNLVSGQNDYSVKTDGSSLDILRVFDVQILGSSTAADYTTLEKLTLDDPRALAAMSPNSSETGTPTHWLERDNTVFLYPKPNYAATAGVKIFYEREQARFTPSTLTQEPGIPVPFHPLLVFIACHDYVALKQPSNTALITRLESKMSDAMKNLTDMASARNPVTSRIGLALQNNH